MSAVTRSLNGLTLNHASAGLSLGTTSTYSTSASTVCSIGGKFATALGTQTNTATPTTDAVTGAAFVAQGINTACAYLFGVNAAGAIKVCQGPIVSTLPGVTTTVGSFNDAPMFATPPDDFCPIGYTIVRTAPSAASWTFGSSNWTATGVTALACVNISEIPERSQTS